MDGWMDGWNQSPVAVDRARLSSTLRTRATLDPSPVRDRDPKSRSLARTDARRRITADRFIHRSIRESDSSSTDRASLYSSSASFDAAIRDDARGVVARGVDVARRERYKRRASRGRRDDARVRGGARAADGGDDARDGDARRRRRATERRGDDGGIRGGRSGARARRGGGRRTRARGRRRARDARATRETSSRERTRSWRSIRACCCRRWTRRCT